MKNYKRIIFSWSIYDFANQPFTTIILTFVYSAFFADYMVIDDSMDGTVLWGRAITICSIIIALISPIMGAIADRAGYRKFFLIFWTWICVIFSFFLYFPLPGQVYSALLFFCLANIGFEMGGIYLNAYLPEIAPKEKIGRISGYGWSFGYVGGLIALGLCYILFIAPDNPVIWNYTLNKETYEHIRFINIFISIWLAVFSIPTFLYLKDKQKYVKINSFLIKESYQNLKKTFIEIKKYKHIVNFLVARLVYNDALITIIAFGGIYATKVFDFDFSEIFLFGIILNIAAGLGSFLFGFLDDIIGGKSTIQITNIGYIFACLIVIIAPEINSFYIPGSDILITGKNLFWFSGTLIGIFMGPNQSASRSLMGRLIPESKENEFYGFFAFSGKATAFVGPLILSTIVSYTDSLQYGLISVIFLFILGTILLSKVDV